MQLKEYQQRALEGIRSYLELLTAWRRKAEDNADHAMRLKVKDAMKALRDSETELKRVDDKLTGWLKSIGYVG